MVKKEMKYSATPGVFLGPCSKVKSAFLLFSQKESRFHKSETTFYRLVGLSVTLQTGRSAMSVKFPSTFPLTVESDANFLVVCYFHCVVSSAVPCNIVKMLSTVSSLSTILWSLCCWFTWPTSFILPSIVMIQWQTVTDMSSRPDKTQLGHWLLLFFQCGFYLLEHVMNGKKTENHEHIRRIQTQRADVPVVAAAEAEHEQREDGGTSYSAEEIWS